MTPNPLTKDIDELLSQIPLLNSDSRVVTPLAGGLTNASYRVQTEEGDYLMRVLAPNLEQFGIDRDNERANMTAAEQAGVGPKVVANYPELGVMVTSFVPGRALTSGDLEDPFTVERITSSIRQLHKGPHFRGTFDAPKFRREYLQTVRSLHLNTPSDFLANLGAVESIEARLASTPELLVPCHNDLAPENMIDDGERVWLVDFEFAAMNEPSFDLANLALASLLRDDQIRTLVSSYWGNPSPQKLARTQGWIVVASFAWVLWAEIQQHSSSANFDFVAWGRTRYEQAVTRLNKDSFWDLLQELPST